MRTACTLIRIFSKPGCPPRFSRWCFLCSILFLSALACSTQETGLVAQRPIQSATELVKIETTVLDHDGNFVGGLAQSSFRILDNGVEQPIAFFEPVEAPAQVLVMLETSPAVYLISEQHLAAAYALLDGLAPDDEVALVTYDAAPRPALAFTVDKPALLAALGQMQYTIGMGELNFYDSLSTVLDWLAPVTGKKAIIVLTTGLDSSPPARWDSLVRKLRGNDVVIFSVALGGPLRAAPPKKAKQKKSASATGDASEQALAESITAAGFAKADDALRSLAAITGGRAYFPQSDKEFASIYRKIAVALRHQYVLGIAPAHDNQFHPLDVEVLGSSSHSDARQTNQAQYRVFARAGYLAPGP
jgi:Ca-activated chloride channel homolog